MMSRLMFAVLVIGVAWPAHRSAPVEAAPALQVLAAPGGQPDDITVDGRHRLVWGDLAAGTVDRLQGGRVVIVARSLSVPEGIVALGGGGLVVAEQGNDSITRIGPKGKRTVLRRLQPVAGQEGVDGIGRDPRTGDLLIPDSPNGAVYRMSLDGRRLTLLTRGLGRPVAAAMDRSGNVLVPDEHLGALVVVSRAGRVSYRGPLATPDDVAVDRKGRIWVTTLGDGGLWEMTSGSARRVVAGLASPQGLTLDRCGDPIVVEQNGARIVRVLLTGSSRRCAL